MASSSGIRAMVVASLALLLGIVALAGAPPASAQSGADLEASLSGPRTVKYGANITYTITATNIGDETATGVQLTGWVPDWFNFVSVDCLTGTVSAQYGGSCDFADVAPGGSVSMTMTLEACCPEKHMFELAWSYATNDVNTSNDQAEVKLNFRGPTH